VIKSLLAGVIKNRGFSFEGFPGFFYIISVSLSVQMGRFKGVNMKEDTQLKDLNDNYEKLEDENKDKLLLIGKKLLSIKSLVKGETEPENENGELRFNNERLV
jgi:hypothetical protein